jgi:hypothetical protein
MTRLLLCTATILALTATSASAQSRIPYYPQPYGQPRGLDMRDQMEQQQLQLQDQMRRLEDQSQRQLEMEEERRYREEMRRQRRY